MPYLDLRDHARLFYLNCGSGKPVVFLSSLGLTSKTWQYQMVPMVDSGFRCIAYDRRGHGRSDQPGHGYDYDSLADDLAELLEANEVSDATLVGASIASGEIVRYLTRHGDSRVAKVAFVSPVGPFPLRTSDNPKGINPEAVGVTEAAWRHDYTEWLDANIDGYFGKGLDGCEVSDGLINWAKAEMQGPLLQAMIECNRALMYTDLRTEMAKVTLPTLIIDGDHDLFIPAEISGEVCADLIGGSTFKLYANAPHFLHLTHREQFTSDLLSFVSE